MTKQTTFEFKAGDYFNRDALTAEQYKDLGRTMVDQGYSPYEFKYGEDAYRNFYYFGINDEGELYHSDSPLGGRHLTYEEVVSSGSQIHNFSSCGHKASVQDVYLQMFLESKENQTIYHFRNTDKGGKVLSNGGVTVVLVRLQQTGEILIGISACSAEDNFDRKSGVMLAKTRMKATGQSLEKVPAKHELRAFIGRYCDEDTKRIFKTFKGGAK